MVDVLFYSIMFPIVNAVLYLHMFWEYTVPQKAFHPVKLHL